jgi:hypothetical protein
MPAYNPASKEQKGESELKSSGKARQELHRDKVNVI